MSRHGRHTALADLDDFRANLEPVAETGGVTVFNDWYDAPVEPVADAPAEPVAAAAGLPAADVPDALEPVAVAADIPEALDGAELAVVVVPCSAYERWVRAIAPHVTADQALLLVGGAARPVRWCWRRRWARPPACLPGDRRAGGRGIGHAGPGFSRRGPDSGRPRPRRAGRDRAGRLRPHRHVRVSCPHAPVRAWFAPPARTGFVWCARMPALHATTRYLVRYGKCLPRAAGAVTVPQRERRGAAARRRRAACLAWDGITHD